MPPRSRCRHRPSLEATSWVLVDQQSGQVLAGHRANDAVEPASITKLMTAYAVFHALKEGKLKLDTEVPISEHAWRSEGSRTYLDLNSRVPVEVLIQGMIVQSGNDATIALAEAVAGTEDTFAALMNQYAERLGMAQSHFQNATGLPGDNHKMSAADIAKLTRAIIREFPEYYRWYSQREFTWNNIRQPNRNGLLARDPSVDGIKTGMTDAAGYCLVSSAKRDGMRLIAVVTGTKSMKAREDASLALLNYGFNFYETRVLKKAGDGACRAPRLQGARRACRGRPRARTSRSRCRAARRTASSSDGARAARVRAADEVGPRRRRCAPARRQGRRRGADLHPLADVPRGNIFRRIWDTILSWFA